MRNIIYLDEAKMFSLSAQIFEGLTDYVFRENTTEITETENQEGRVFSGKVMAEAMRKGERTTEKRFMHDHAYALFEAELTQRGILTSIDSSVDDIEILGCKGLSFVKITARVQFADTDKVAKLIGSFNQFGAALTTVTAQAAIQEVKSAFETKRQQVKDKAKIAALHREEREVLEKAKKDAAGTLYQDPEFLEKLSFLLDYAYAGVLEVSQRIGAYQYTSHLRRDNLRESDDLTIRKYSRTTEREVVVLGVVTQSAGQNDADEIPDIAESSSLREAVNGMIGHIANIERSMFGKGEMQVVVDPIAIYVNL